MFLNVSSLKVFQTSNFCASSLSGITLLIEIHRYVYELEHIVSIQK
jgi:hypothetical protein